VDPFTRWIELCAVTDLESATTAQTLYDSIIYRHGAPCELQTDGHKTFEGPSMQQLYARFAIDHHVTVAYHPQSNGVAERRNRDVMHALRAYVGNNFTTWDEFVMPVQWHANTSFNRSIGQTPYQARYGHKGRTAIAAQAGALSGISKLEQLASAIAATQELAVARVLEATRREKEAYEAGRTAITYVPGEYVLVRRAEPENKLATAWRGPYVVKEHVGENVCLLADVLLDNEIKVHVTRMRPFSMERTSVDAEAARMLRSGLVRTS
jgi:hypothetical protein